MTEIRNERRRFTRVALDLPVEVHQGGSMWPQRLIDVSLSGVATDQPDLWDAQYNEPFTLVIKLEDGKELELYAYLQHVEAGRLGFSVQHVDRENIEPLMALLGQHMDIASLEEELARLEAGPD
ncbi:PilZ domain-containing protein [Seongchinamella sediminis]|uniref:PilZ domain-containing protein n=1 Tax=Seongchinamella sediminis TaxID=2283635 RepID=A0A3L7E009_9GAMM|nr:PilZ domain-containing protein [Seongchinamella sediminis]RLQ22245.1 PilZ domain-containing protein [Seongchinamella sediminis]